MKKVFCSTTASQSIGLFEGTLVVLLGSYDVHLLSSPGQRLEEIGVSYGVQTHSVKMYRRLSPFKDLYSLFLIVKLFLKEKPYMVHSMTPKAGLLCMLGSWLTRVPVRVHTFTGLVWPTEKGIKRKLLMLTDRVTCLCATNIIPEGEGVKADLINYRITNKPMRVLGYGNVRGVDLKRFSKRSEVIRKAKPLCNNSVITFIYVGRIVREKGINELCEAFNRLNNEYHSTRLFLVGKFENDIDPVSDTSNSIIHSNDSVFAIGPQSGDDLISYYAASDCFVLPSYREGFPNTVLEAGAMGLPSIVTDINGSREIIRDGFNGFIIPPHNVDALYEAMESMVILSEKRSEMSAIARQHIADHFDRDFVRKCLNEFYSAVL